MAYPLALKSSPENVSAYCNPAGSLGFFGATFGRFLFFGGKEKERKTIESNHQTDRGVLMLQMYSRLVQRCFDDCVNDFTTKSLVSREEGCVLRCVDKYLKASARLGERFQEQNAAMMQSGQLPGR